MTRQLQRAKLLDDARVYVNTRTAAGPPIPIRWSFNKEKGWFTVSLWSPSKFTRYGKPWDRKLRRDAAKRLAKQKWLNPTA